MVNNFKQLIKFCKKQQWAISRVALQQEIELGEQTTESIYARMEAQLCVMERSVERGLQGVQSHSGLTGGDARLLAEYRSSGRSIADGIFLQSINYALAVNEVNAAMGVICATPTAGSAGVVPAVLFAARERLSLSRRDQLNFLLTAGLCGIIIGNNAGISGARGGCQAEIGSASAMAAAALAEAAGGDARTAVNAAAIALMNLLGLSCDPVAGLVEIPCIQRNALGAANAYTAAEMALAGIESKIPGDEVVQAMARIGEIMPEALKETALGGLAQTPTAIKMARALKKNKRHERTDCE